MLQGGFNIIDYMKHHFKTHCGFMLVVTCLAKSLPTYPLKDMGKTSYQLCIIKCDLETCIGVDMQNTTVTGELKIDLYG